MSKSIFILYITLFCAKNISSQQTSNTTLKAKYNTSEGFVTHEWGTFTTLQKSNGELLSGLEKEEEHLPDFVYNLALNYKVHSFKGYYFKVYELKNVKVKMETPVLYFYSPESIEKDVSVEVKFRNGSISQWYPYRTGGEIIPDTTFYTSGDGYYYKRIIDFSELRIGSIKWDASILPKTDNSNYTNNIKQEIETWVRPRATESNLVKIKNVPVWDTVTKQFLVGSEIEKFLFYRGIGNFEQPIKVEFNTHHNLVLHNLNNDTIKYAMVYEKRRDGKKIIWWSGTVKAQSLKVIKQPLNDGIRGPEDELENFVTKLIEAGLYEDEARAMLKTWEKSYFEHEGLKVFWIAPSRFTNEILPININPKPDGLKRVIIGRSEVLTPEFEKELMAVPYNSFSDPYSNDRFSLAYTELRLSGIPQYWTDYNFFTDDEIIETASNITDIEIFPNPVTGHLTIAVPKDKSEGCSINIYNQSGSVVKSLSTVISGENCINMADMLKGIYVLKINFIDGKFISKKIVKD